MDERRVREIIREELSTREVTAGTEAKEDAIVDKVIKKLNDRIRSIKTTSVSE